MRTPYRKKIINDPIYGFINIPDGLIFTLLEHRYFQRLHRIKQVSLSHYVYPGALHTRFHHALGAFHLMTQAIATLRNKGVDITEAEEEGVSAAILLHDIGHGPYSHTLENNLINVAHEEISILFMETINEELGGALDVAIQIFKNEYPKRFLHQLVSGQLDMDRLDYLSRDSFFTGVYEGVVGYDRIIQMLAVRDNELVVEEKGIYSVEKFLNARRLMYWQVYLHKTAVVAEQMLIRALQRARELRQSGFDIWVPPHLAFFMDHAVDSASFRENKKDRLDHFAMLDDYDVAYAIKHWTQSEDPILAYLTTGLLNRKLLRIEVQHEPFSPEYVEKRKEQTLKLGITDNPDLLPYLVFEGQESNNAYHTNHDEIKIAFKNGTVLPISKCIDFDLRAKNITKYYLSFPKVL